jgi:hypothetical protein
MTAPLLIDALGDPEPTDVAGLLGPDVRFHSPYADYAGREDVAHLMGLIRAVLVDMRVTRRLSDGPDTMSQFESEVRGDGRVDEVQGVLVEHRDDAGLLVEAMLTLRPYAGLRASMRAMEPLLAASPLPSRTAAGDDPTP